MFSSIHVSSFNKHFDWKSVFHQQSMQYEFVPPIEDQNMKTLLEYAEYFWCSFDMSRSIRNSFEMNKKTCGKWQKSLLAAPYNLIKDVNVNAIRDSHPVGSRKDVICEVGGATMVLCFKTMVSEIRVLARKICALGNARTPRINEPMPIIQAVEYLSNFHKVQNIGRDHYLLFRMRTIGTT